LLSVGAGEVLLSTTLPISVKSGRMNALARCTSSLIAVIPVFMERKRNPFFQENQNCLTVVRDDLCLRWACSKFNFELNFLA